MDMTYRSNLRTRSNYLNDNSHCSVNEAHGITPANGATWLRNPRIKVRNSLLPVSENAVRYQHTGDHRSRRRNNQHWSLIEFSVTTTNTQGTECGQEGPCIDWPWKGKNQRFSWVFSKTTPFLVRWWGCSHKIVMLHASLSAIRRPSTGVSLKYTAEKVILISLEFFPEQSVIDICNIWGRPTIERTLKPCSLVVRPRRIEAAIMSLRPWLKRVPS